MYAFIQLMYISAPIIGNEGFLHEFQFSTQQCRSEDDKPANMVRLSHRMRKQIFRRLHGEMIRGPLHGSEIHQMYPQGRGHTLLVYRSSPKILAHPQLSIPMSLEDTRAFGRLKFGEWLAFLNQSSNQIRGQEPTPETLFSIIQLHCLVEPTPTHSPHFSGMIIGIHTNILPDDLQPLECRDTTLGWGEQLRNHLQVFHQLHRLPPIL